MRYTEEQYKYLKLCDNGLMWEWFKNDNGDDVLHFLMDEGLVVGQHDAIRTTQTGKRELALLEYAQKQEAERKQAETEKAEADSVKADENATKQFKRDLLVAAFGSAFGIVAGLAVQFGGKLIKIIYELIRSLGA